jgi:hypothetical protein
MNKEINENFIMKEALDKEVDEVKMDDLKFSCVVLDGSNAPVQAASSFPEDEDLNENEI